MTPTDASATGPSFEAHLPEYLVDATFPNRELALERLVQFGADGGFRLSIRSSGATTTYVSCGRARSSRAARPDGGAYTSCTRCPYSVKICTSPLRRDSVVVRMVNALHNHAPAPEGLVMHASRPAKRIRNDSTPPPPSPSPRVQPRQPSTPSSLLGSSTVDDADACAHASDATTDIEAEQRPVVATLDDASMASHVSHNTASSAVRGLLSLSLPSTTPTQSRAAPQPRPAQAAHPAPSKEATSPPPASSTDATVMFAMLRHPPSDLMNAVAKLSYHEAQKTLEGVRILSAMLQIQERLQRPKS